MYAGTENGIYISLDDGRNWQPFQLNLPTVPITDLTIRNNDLVASTQGRSFWILDDLTPLHQYSNRIKKSKMHFFNPRPSYRVSGSSSPSKTIGQNPPNGAVFHYYLKDKPNDKDKFSLEILYKNKIIFKRIHGWKYSYNYEKTPYLSIWNKKINLGICGDWLSGPKVENAWLSANDLARKIK